MTRRGVHKGCQFRFNLPRLRFLLLLVLSSIIYSPQFPPYLPASLLEIEVSLLA
jgi:hypothetical protein